MQESRLRSLAVTLTGRCWKHKKVLLIYITYISLSNERMRSKLLQLQCRRYMLAEGMLEPQVSQCLADSKEGGQA